MKINNISSHDFWCAIDKLVSESEIIIDRPKGSKHPRIDYEYVVDYGYLSNTTSMDDDGIDIYKGSLNTNICDSIIVTVDLFKRDSEMKILIGCTDEETKAILEFHNSSELMKGILVNRYE